MRGVSGKVWALVGGLAVLSACHSVPQTRIREPLSARPPAVQAQPEANGAIYQPGSVAFWFEDRRARRVGDTLTVNLVERTSASRRSETTESRKATAKVDVPTPKVLGVSPNAIGQTAWTPSAESAQAFKDNDANSNTISGAITVSVVEVLANGHLVVAGEKQVSVNNDTDFIRLAGVVNPAHITAANTVNSTQLANVQIEYKNSQGLEASQITSMFARFFLTLLPF
ncbi:MAG: flagellar basal body L-ring protein FlgH [Thiobacillaceae bacterium]|nr:flagellar basal body L-ring protein FlgH [Thiobacillaceae bacterium]MCX7673800.1 flagellar basal body L-ring protein FlgH [Thiobacillaceae bacterium]MDW8323558.1 flagellar basal body L-ring protein FlgH [Burkholderiales bacterium]